MGKKEKDNRRRSKSREKRVKSVRRMRRTQARTGGGGRKRISYLFPASSSRQRQSRVPKDVDADPPINKKVYWRATWKMYE